MANTKISQLTENTNPTWWEELVYAYNNANGKMSLNTMKTFVQNNLSWYATTADLAGKQDTLVSWTNIKTVNWYSLLWSWNIVISWWWGWDWQIIYEAIVDYSGNWDYTTLWAALQAWATSIYIKNGTYNESPVEVEDNNFLIVWETEWWVILNYQIDSTTPYCIKYTNPTRKSITDYIYNIIKWVTINVSTNSNSYQRIINSSLIDYTAYYNLLIEWCTINVTNVGTWSPIFCISEVPWATLWTWDKWNWHSIIDKCLITMKNWTPTNTIRYYDSGNSSTRCAITNSKLYIINDWSWAAWLVNESGSRFENCEILVSCYAGTWNTQVMLNNASNCVVRWVANTTTWWWWELRNCTWCDIQFTNFNSVPAWFKWSTSVTDWEESTSYSVWDYVRDWSYIWECTEAHTSWDTIDYSKFEAVNSIRLYSRISWCKINISWWIISIEAWAYSWNNITAQMIMIIQDESVTVWNTINSVNTIKLVWKWQLLSWNHFWWFTSSDSWTKWIYYTDNYNIIKDNVLVWTNTPWINIVWTTTNTSKVSDNITY